MKLSAYGRWEINSRIMFCIKLIFACIIFPSLLLFQEQLGKKDSEHNEEVNRLKTEIATLKLNRLAPASPRFGQKEVERLNQELSIKSEQIVDLHREVALLKIEVGKQFSLLLFSR